MYQGGQAMDSKDEETVENGQELEAQETVVEAGVAEETVFEETASEEIVSDETSETETAENESSSEESASEDTAGTGSEETKAEEKPKKKPLVDPEVGKRILDFIDKGVEASKKGIHTASVAINKFGDKSVTHIELAQLKVRLEREYTAFGKTVYASLKDSEDTSVDFAQEDIAGFVTTIGTLLANIQKKEDALKAADAPAPAAGEETSPEGETSDGE